jgi:hypothetical protein
MIGKRAIKPYLGIVMESDNPGFSKSPFAPQNQTSWRTALTAPRCCHWVLQMHSFTRKIALAVWNDGMAPFCYLPR